MKKVCHKYLEFVNGLFLNPGRSLKMAALLLAAGFAVAACRVDEQFEEQEDGLPAAVSVRLSLPDMTVQTRSLTDNQASAVNHIWLGIYDAASGRLKGSFEKAVSHEDRHVLHQLDNIISSSGNSYIVAVANAKDNYGMSSGIEGVATDASGRANLLDLLHNADTWDKYRSIAVALQNTSVVEYTEANVVMTGSYTSATGINANHPLGPDVESVYLKGGNNNLPGRIHLRRVISQVTFNITAGTGITIRPTSWRVVNNPRLSFLQERQDNSKDNNGKDVTNAGDVITAHLDDAAPNANYGASHPETEIAGSSTAGYSFSFYTYENKRTGTAADYDAREKEHKLDDGSNTGIYVALCGESTESPNVKNGVNLNNFATYVEIKCEVNYTYDEHPRTGTAVYTVHLGYVDNDADGYGDANDFNVRRNYKYTYNMQVLGLNQIVIEAKKEEGEPHPGIEGDVIDATQSIVTVDAHYGVYNIQLSNVERARLHYYMEAPYGGEVKVVEGGYPKGGGERLPTPNTANPYYNWIRIKPTSGERIFAEYKSSTTDEPWYLDDLVGVDANHRGYGDNTGSLTDNTQRWYTVFINEYVYEGTYDGVEHGLSDWVNFVNQDMRTVLFLVQDIAVSDDTESRYSQGKYLLRQRSIQTYYSTDPAVMGENPTALGAEHINESYGKNIDWRWVATTSSPDGTSLANTVLSNRNGRWNLWKFLNNATNARSNNGITNTTATRSWVCASELDDDTGRNGSWGVMRYVNASGTDRNNRNNHYMRANYEGYAVPEIAHYTAASNTRNQDPQSVDRYYEAVALCMSRNRDLNGNGSIEPNEVRWYLPAEGKYERLMLGRNSLVTPLFSTSNGSYYTNSADDIAVSKNNFGFNGTIVGYGADNQVQYISSDHYKFYTEEGGSYNPDLRIYWLPEDGSKNYGRYPWNIRCVRNLGVSMETVTQDPNADPVEKAYSYDAANREFDMTHYFGNSLRANISTYMEVHTLTDLDKNKTPRKLKVSSTHASYTLGTTVNEQSYSSVKEALDANYPCANYSETGDGGATWRAPNQRELMMMMNEQLLNTQDLITFSCTMESYGTKSRYACSDGSSKYMFMNRNLPAPNTDKDTFSVRCVRDIE